MIIISSSIIIIIIIIIVDLWFPPEAEEAQADLRTGR